MSLWLEPQLIDEPSNEETLLVTDWDPRRRSPRNASAGPSLPPTLRRFVLALTPRRRSAMDRRPPS